MNSNINHSLNVCTNYLLNRNIFFFFISNIALIENRLNGIYLKLFTKKTMLKHYEWFYFYKILGIVRYIYLNSSWFVEHLPQNRPLGEVLEKLFLSFLVFNLKCITITIQQVRLKKFVKYIKNVPFFIF